MEPPSAAAIPDRLRAQLVSELDAATAAGNEARVRDAELALGRTTPTGSRDRLAAAMRALLRHRAPTATICPSDAARVVGGAGFRDLMDDARSVAAELSATGAVRVTQRGTDVDLQAVRGTVRIARGPSWPG